MYTYTYVYICSYEMSYTQNITFQCTHTEHNNQREIMNITTPYAQHYSSVRNPSTEGCTFPCGAVMNGELMNTGISFHMNMSFSFPKYMLGKMKHLMMKMKHLMMVNFIRNSQTVLGAALLCIPQGDWLQSLALSLYYWFYVSFHYRPSPSVLDSRHFCLCRLHVFPSILWLIFPCIMVCPQSKIFNFSSPLFFV